MGTTLSSDFVEQVRNAGDIVRLVADYVPLKQAGRRYKGLCPFHQEKTPSFSVDPERQLFYCFGCRTGGDAFKFLMLYEKLDFPESVKFLANRWGVPLPAADPAAAKRADERERIRAMNAHALDWFRGMLADAEAGAAGRAYLERRGISRELADALQLGYAPDQWEGLSRHLRAKRYTPQEMIRGGLVLERKSGTGHYDRFRHRLIFPIRDVMGRPIAFGGRTLGDDPAKYINSPETPAYTKGDHLYGLDLAKEAIRREGLAIVVEGYLDLAAVKQAGFDHVVASLGTAFTPNQARLLARCTQRVVFSYDGDAAGADATQRSLDLLLERGFEARILDLPEGQDPDDFIRAEGAEAYGKRVMQAEGWLDHLIRREAAAAAGGPVEDKVAAVNRVLPHVARLGSAIERAAWVAKLADATGIEEDLVLHELRNAAKAARPEIRTPAAADRPALRPAEARLVALLLRSETDRSRLFDRWDPELFRGAAVENILRVLLRRIEADAPVDYPAVLDSLIEETDRDLLTHIAFRDEPDEGPTLDDCLHVFERQQILRKERAVLRSIAGGGARAGTDEEEAAGATEPDSSTDIDRRLHELMELARRRDALM